MLGLEEPYLCIKAIFVGFSSVLWLVLDFGWKFQVKRGKPVISLEIAVEYRFCNLSTGTQSGLRSRGCWVLVLRVDY